MFEMHALAASNTAHDLLTCSSQVNVQLPLIFPPARALGEPLLWCMKLWTRAYDTEIIGLHLTAQHQHLLHCRSLAWH